MSLYLGIDTSAYTSSAAIYNSQNGEIIQSRRPLRVPPGKLGLRQSEAFFQHVNALPCLLSELLSLEMSEEVKAAAVSAWPRRRPESYMPVFRAGIAAARMASQVRGWPLYAFSHQEGHLFAGLYEYPEVLLDSHFIAVHYSGGTSEILSVNRDFRLPVRVEPAASSSDLNVGQLIDRVGLKLGLSFPAGPGLEKLAAGSLAVNAGRHSIRIPFKDGRLSFSGAENRAGQLLEQGVPPADLARILFQAIAESLAEAILHTCEQKGGRKVLLAGGVMANAIITETLTGLIKQGASRLQLYFTSPLMSADNAAGIAYLAYLVDSGALPGREEEMKGLIDFEI